MNRRSLLKNVAAAVTGGLICPEIQAEEKPELQTPHPNQSRQQRYKEYGRLLDEHPRLFSKFHDVVLANPVNNFLSTWELAKTGDLFLEILSHQTYQIGVQLLPTATMYRIETIKNNLIEFQQSNDGPDYAAMARFRVDDENAFFDLKCRAVRFKPEEIIHISLASDIYYPYGTSLLEAAFREEQWCIANRRSFYHLEDFISDAMIANFVKSTEWARKILEFRML